MKRSHSEYWFPTDKPLNIYQIKTPTAQLRPIEKILNFSWAKPEEVKTWLDLLAAYKVNGKLPTPLSIDKNLWPPSGMESMDDAFDWAIKNSNGEVKSLWKFYYGTWLAGSGFTEQALSQLSDSPLGLAKALRARLLKIKGDADGAASAMRSVSEPWLQLHPQIVVERDKVLRSLGKQTLAEREKWLTKVNALQDEWVIERRVQLLIDQSKFQGAKKLLLSSHFQKVHQTYTRTNLWKQICDNLKEPFEPIPASLGEDRLAIFGAYREFE